MMKFWSYSQEYKKIKKTIFKSIDKTLNSGKLFYGPELEKFEHKFNKFNKSKYGLAVGSGTDALFIALKTLNIGLNDEVITVSNTAIPTVSAIVTAGAKVRFVDIGTNYLINVNKIEQCITKKTKAIIPVHLYGQACDMNQICKLAKKYNLKVIEDCAQAQGAKYKNTHVGSIGDVGCFSFYPTKILGAYGDGGFLTTKSQKLYEKMKRMRFYGIDNFNKKNKYNNKYYSNEHGINSRISEIQLSILNIKLPKVNYWINKRRKIAKIYSDALKKTSLKLPSELKGNKDVYHLYTVYHPKRKLIMKEMKKKKINLKIYYPFPIHKMKGYKEKTSNSNYLPVTEKMSHGIFSLPLYPEIKLSDVKKIIKSLKSVLNTI